MSTERTYKCNLCRSRIDPPEEGKGIHFTSGGLLPFIFKSVQECENHICIDCLAAIRNLEKGTVE